MNYKKIEELFVDFILDIIGPNPERESERNNNLSIAQKIISKILSEKLPDYITYVFPYGSFPTKTYLKDADIDITIFFESKMTKKILFDLPLQLIDKSLLSIKEGFDIYNTKQKFELISDIKIINAGIRLLKCKIGSISLDISINNFSGLYKILFIDFIESQLKIQMKKKKLFNDNSYKENKINIFRRTLLLIKGWCFYEGKLMGSNIGLMASYTLEILVIYLFNLHYDEINNEYEGFEKFFELMQKLNWETNIISLYGIISNFNFYQKLSNFNENIQDENKTESNINQPFWYLEKEYNTSEKDDNNEETKYGIRTLRNDNIEPLLNINELKKFITSLNKGLGNIHLKKEGNSINGENFHKLVNVLDPLNNHNNLGKSINYHSNSKMKIVILYMNKTLKNIQEIRKRGNPFLYLNSLLNLFKSVLSNTFVEIFASTLNTPEIIVNSKIYKKYNNNNNWKNIKIEKTDIQKFNNLFLENPRNDDRKDIEEEDYDEYVEEPENLEEIEFDKEEEEDEDEFAEEDEEENKNAIDEDADENQENLEIKENIVFKYLINNEIMNKLNEQNKKTQENVKYNNKLLNESKKYSDDLQKALKDFKLI
jgi:hypothetical protein